MNVKKCNFQNQIYLFFIEGVNFPYITTSKEITKETLVFFIRLIVFIIKNVIKNNWSSNSQNFKNTQLQIQNPGSYKKNKV